MVHQNSVAGDDGSHRLLIVPCALVVLVLVLMVTACSTVDGQSGGGGGVAAVADVDGTDDVPDGGESSDGGTLAEPEITEDGRMLQPDGHVGIWFETEPTDSLEKLVYESQRYVGQSVMLEPIGDRALMPQWEDMPDPCHPEVMRRMGELGFEVVEDGGASTISVQCSVIGQPWGPGAAFDTLIWGVDSEVGRISGGIENRPSGNNGISLVEGGGLSDVVGCIALFEHGQGNVFLWSSYPQLAQGMTCCHSEILLSIILNVGGGNISVSV
ncbi:hypothetical protein [Corynebacterium sp.]|uniref:hypothetical protein n=1 Tax=Corynebacterium sp. TaxID=1720 RepID=UPI003B3A8114